MRVLREAEAGSRAALAALDDVGRWLGFGLAGLVNVLNPRPRRPRWAASAGSIRLSRATLDAELDRRALPAPRALVRVVPARLGVDAPLLGAAELAFEPLLADPAAVRRPRDGCPSWRRA